MSRLRRSPVLLGITVLVAVVAALVVVYQKDAIRIAFSSGQQIQAEFAKEYKLDADKSDVKIAGVIVGKVSGIEETADGHSLVSMKLDDGVVDRLGSTPSATIRATTLLGGNYYVDLAPAGDGKKFPGGAIPVERTHLPVELDQVLQAVPEPAQKGLQSMTRQLDATLAHGGTQSIQTLVAEAPGTLGPGADVLNALQGTQPGTDLSGLVTNLDGLAAVMTRRDGQLGSIVDNLATTTAALSAGSKPLARTLDGLPGTLASTRAGLQSLDGTFDRLDQTADKARPAVRELSPLLTKTDAAIRQTAPLVSELRPLLGQLRPVVQQLVPTAQNGTATLDNLGGPVMDRVSGPIMHTVLSPWHGTGDYQGNGNDHLLYQEVGYLAARAANLSQYGDKNGPLLALALGAGASSVGGTDLSVYQYLQSIGTLPEGTAPAPAPAAGPASPALPPLPLGSGGLTSLLSGSGR
ncbi:MCE family protein [Amycolatopsis sp. K13G38]|uniref:MCE family protein n=1 Tax=Amycolatopsis acididurans TaxID=2724524 RepID=A0ABX1J750_9PSEU|nr:MlaD family protein [Amycolatopsis acididurans]NKQ54245.1 MCE family protein [Amycolatopsis acididurans]